MTPFECYIAIIKGYCVVLILLLPKAFAGAGYLTSALLVLVAGLISGSTACLLAKAGLRENIYSYPMLVHKAFGNRGRICADVVIGLAQYSFTISHISFVIKTFHTFVNATFEIQTTYMPYLVFALCVFAPLAWDNNIAKFSSMYLVGTFLLLLCILTVAVFCGLKMIKNNDIGPNVFPNNPDGFWIMVGFSIYCYEGIGIIMPVLKASAEPD